MLGTSGKRNIKTIDRPLLLLTLLLTIMVPGFVRGAQQDDSAHKVKVPQTAKDHYELAEHYRKEADELRGEITMHKEMLAEFSKNAAQNPKSGENPYVKNMRLHCEKYIKAAETFAAEATESARFHTLRAKELEGK